MFYKEKKLNELSGEERENLFNYIMDKNIKREDQSKGTDGKLTIDEYLKKNEYILNNIDRKDIKYIFYQKSGMEKSILPIILIILYSLTVNFDELIIPLFFFILMELHIYKSIILTKKGIYFYKFKFYHERLKFSDIEKIVFYIKSISIYSKTKRRTICNENLTNFYLKFF